MAKELEPTQKHTLHLYEGDFERLGDLHPGIPASLVVRQLVRKHLKETETPIDPLKVGKVLV